MVELKGDKEEVKTDPVTGQQYIVIDVRCLGCSKPVSPQEVDWDLFRNFGIPVHAANEDCLHEVAEKMHGAPIPR